MKPEQNQRESSQNTTVNKDDGSLVMNAITTSFVCRPKQLKANDETAIETLPQTNK